jgi:hypothetical protein
MSEQHSTLQILGYLLGSGFFGSLFTTWVIRFFDSKKEKKDRKLWIFRVLMANFQNRFCYDIVSAINLVEVDFDGDNNVKKAWKNYLKTLKPKNPNPTDEQAKACLEEIDNALAELLKSIGASLGYKRDKLDILNNSFIPGRWQNDDFHIRRKEQLLMEVLENKRSLNFNVTNSQDNSIQKNNY